MNRSIRTLTALIATGALATGVALAAPAPSSAPLMANRAVAAARASVQSVTAARASAQSVTAAQQLQWLIGATAQLPISTAGISAHVSSAVLAQIGGPAALNAALEAIGPLTVTQRLEQRTAHVEAVVRGSQGQYELSIGVGGSGLIDLALFTPYLPGAPSWQALDTRLRALAPQVGFAAAQITTGGGCRLIHGLNPDQPRPLGSSFKLYVLGALAHAVAEHQASWNQQLRIRTAWKSLPSGVLQNEPAGTALTLRQFADLMISISDNTAADHLLHHLGRGAVERELGRLGNHHAGLEVPFPTTRELFALKGVDYPAAAEHYLTLAPAGRLAMLDRLDRIPRASIPSWTAPRDIDRIEWFASPMDICRAYAGLSAQERRPGMGPIGHALSINDGGIGLDRRRYPTVWFKGGSEPGVLTLTYLVRTADGRTLVDALTLADPAKPFPPAATAQLLALARSGILLADRR